MSSSQSPSSYPSDDELARRYRAGDTDAGRLLLQRHLDRCMAFALGITSDSSQAELLIRHTCTHIQQFGLPPQDPAIRPEDLTFSPLVWSSRALSLLDPPATDELPASSTPSPPETIPDTLSSLSPIQRSVLLLCELTELPFSAIAEMLAIPEEMVRSLLIDSLRTVGEAGERRER